MLKSLGNPQEMITQLIQNNPKMKEVQQLIDAAGGNPEQAFREKAKEMGIDPDQILSILK